MEFELTMEDLATVIMALEDEIRKEIEFQSEVKKAPQTTFDINQQLIRLQSVFYNLSVGDEKLNVIEAKSKSEKRFTIKTK